MKKNLLILPSTLILSTIVLLADKFWEKKAFTEWTGKEAIRMMYKSPWAHPVEFTLQNLLFFEKDPGKDDRRDARLPDPDGTRTNPRAKEFADYSPYKQGGGTEEVIQSRYGSSQDLSHMRVGSHGSSMGDRSQRYASRGGDFGGDTFLLPLIIRWYALPIRHAINRWTTLQSEVKQGWNEDTDGFYIIGISGLPARIFPDHPDHLKSVRERLKSESFLKIKGREPIPAIAVLIPEKRSEVIDVRTGPWQVAVEVYMVFSREQKGSDMITLEDKKVEFVTRIGSLKVKKKFKLKNMVYNGKLEL